MRQHFRAPWSPRLIATTVIFVALLAFAFFTIEGWGRYGVPAIIVLAAVFAIRGYSIHQGSLHVHRLGWSTRFELSRLASAEFTPGATMGSMRALGIGGLFGFVGRFYNSVLGSYRAYATNDTTTVVLDFGGDKIVVTPDSPAEFVEAIKAASAVVSD